MIRRIVGFLGKGGSEKQGNEKGLIPAGGGSVARQIARIDQQKRAMNARSYFELIPDPYKNRIKMEAAAAFHEKGEGVSFNSFLERMALGWLIKRETFFLEAEEQKLKLVKPRDAAIPTDFSGAIFALTAGGSLIGVGSPDAQGGRRIYYDRIKDRVDTEIAPVSQGRLLGPVANGERLASSALTSSEVIALAVKEPENKELRIEDAEVKISYILMTQRFNTVGEEFWKIRDKK